MSFTPGFYPLTTKMGSGKFFILNFKISWITQVDLFSCQTVLQTHHSSVKKLIPANCDAFTDSSLWFIYIKHLEIQTTFLISLNAPYLLNKSKHT